MAGWAKLKLLGIQKRCVLTLLLYLFQLSIVLY